MCVDFTSFPGKVKRIDDTLAHIEKWEHSVNRLAKDFHLEFDDRIKRSIIIEMMPQGIADIVTQNLADSESYVSVKDKILRYIESRHDYGGPKPMDLDMANRLEMDKFEEENEGEAHILRGKGQPFQGYCDKCGEWGHKQAQCPQNQECWTCGKKGHRSFECPDNPNKGKGKGKGGKGGAPKGGKEQKAKHFHQNIDKSNQIP